MSKKPSGYQNRQQNIYKRKAKAAAPLRKELRGKLKEAYPNYSHESCGYLYDTEGNRIGYGTDFEHAVLDALRRKEQKEDNQ